MTRALDIRLEPAGPNRFRIPRAGAMRTEGLLYATREMIDALGEDQAPQQVANVACLPGIVGRSLAMPDFHWGYGFPIGGVAAFDPGRGGVVSPGGIGYDINCGVRLLRTGLSIDEVRPHLARLANMLWATIPSGVGSRRQDLQLSNDALDKVMRQGARFAVEQGYGCREDLDLIEEHGCIGGAEPDDVSAQARDRGRAQLGTLGSGNHFCEIGYVAEVFDADVAHVFGLRAEEVTVLIHTGSRGFGYQVCDDSLQMMLQVARKYGIDLPDKQLCCAPLDSPEAQRYLGVMAAAANFAFANRQVITYFVREALRETIGDSSPDVVYDVCHNIGKWEEHELSEGKRRVFVHRKGATRALPAGDTRLPDVYRPVGQPVLVPGDMGRYSFVLVGTDAAARETFASCCHGAGRLLSRKAAAKQARQRNIIKELEQQGILVRAASRGTVDEEMPDAYKNVADVVRVAEGAGIARKVAMLRPVAVVKG